MLHAVLNGKLNQATAEPQRLEDALTSTVFGTLVLLDAWSVIAGWLGVPFGSSNNNGQRLSRECWFWPRMAFAEPDVVLRIGDTLVVVEAKYESGRHDLPSSTNGDEDLCDQIVRQYRCIREPLVQRVLYPELIEHAIRECSLVQIFVVDARHQVRARRQWTESKRRLPRAAALLLITWQSLFRILNADNLSGHRWAADLRTYLQRCGLDTFDGMSLRPTPTAEIQKIEKWRAAPDISTCQISALLTLTQSDAAALQSWRCP